MCQLREWLIKFISIDFVEFWCVQGQFYGLQTHLSLCAVTARRLRILTRLYAAAADANIQLARSGPRKRVLRRGATVFIRLRSLWLIS